jgi:GAF domain-containing protein
MCAMIANMPINEDQRIKNLLDLEILDTPPEPEFDAIVKVAQRLFNVPMAVVSLVDSERQWFKAKVGLDACETHRDVAFCAHAILKSEVFVVEDATKDARFAQNPLVTGDLGLRFYAGAPLILEDCIHIGTLCVLDTKPREFNDEDREMLRDLAAQVVTIAKLHHIAKSSIEHSHALKSANAA